MVRGAEIALERSTDRISRQSNRNENIGQALTRAIAPDQTLKDAGDSNEVDVDVALDEHGFVHYAKPHVADVVNRSADIVSAAVVAAGASSYSPAFTNCKPVASQFLYHVMFK